MHGDQTALKDAVRCWRFEGTALNDRELIPSLTQSIYREFDIAQTKRRELELLLTEVVTNSLDHGILGLDSTLKKDPKGFEQFFISRAAKLASLREGFIEVSIDQIETATIRIVVQDSGEGFPYPTGDLERMPESLLLAYGRGLIIIRRLCRTVTHIGNGNCLVLEFASQ